jgi:LmbE family N-acetylglucosaminyl deacetylase
MNSILVVCAHPDDELFGAGWLAQQAAHGHAVHLLFTTRGEGGEVGEPPVGPKIRLGEYRSAETHRAALILGARDVTFLPYPDPWMEIGGTPRAVDVAPAVFERAIARAVHTARPDVVLTHGSNGEYGHPQHLYTHRATFNVVADMTDIGIREVLTWCADDGENTNDPITNRADHADLSLDVGPWFTTKLAMANAHRSQVAMFLRNNHVAEIASAVRRRESFKRWTRDMVKRVTIDTPPVHGELRW